MAQNLAAINFVNGYFTFLGKNSKLYHLLKFGVHVVDTINITASRRKSTAVLSVVLFLHSLILIKIIKFFVLTAVCHWVNSVTQMKTTLTRM